MFNQIDKDKEDIQNFTLTVKVFILIIAKTLKFMLQQFYCNKLTWVLINELFERKIVVIFFHININLCSKETSH